MGKIFISYRRTQGDFVDRLAEAVKERIEGTVFVDLTGIMEDDFEHALTDGVQSCDVFILVVATDTFAPERIVDEGDWIRREVSLALNSRSQSDPTVSIPIVLALVEGCVPPKKEALPENIRGIATKQGIEFRRPFFDQSVEHLVDHIVRLTHGAIVRKPSQSHQISGHLDTRLKQSIREAIEQLTRELVRGMNSADEQVNLQSRTMNAWTASEGLIALLYMESSPIAARSTETVNSELVARLAAKLVRIDLQIKEGGIPAMPDFRVADRGVVDSTAKVISALCSLRLHMYQHSRSSLGREEPVTQEEINTCIVRLCNWLTRNQNDDGGWGLWHDTKSRVTATAFAVIACLDAGFDPDESFLQSAMLWLQDTQKDDGWWALTSDMDHGDVTSTAFGVAALSMLCGSITNQNVQKAIHALEVNTNWEDAVHTVAVEVGEATQNISMTYAAEPRAVYALLVAGVSPASPTVIKALERLINRELPRGGWSRKGSTGSQMNVWYTYVVVESIYTWFTHCKQISCLVRLSKTEAALAGVVSANRTLQMQAGQLTERIREIHRLASP